MSESARGWRLSIVLRDVEYPAEKWMIQTAAELYGADVRTRSELHQLPEAVYHSIDEVVAAVEHRISNPSAAPTPPRADSCECCDWRG